MYVFFNDPFNLIYILKPHDRPYLCSADIASSFVPANMLLPGLQSKTIHLFTSCIPKNEHLIIELKQNVKYSGAFSVVMIMRPAATEH